MTKLGKLFAISLVTITAAVLFVMLAPKELVDPLVKEMPFLEKLAPATPTETSTLEMDSQTPATEEMVAEETPEEAPEETAQSATQDIVKEVTEEPSEISKPSTGFNVKDAMADRVLGNPDAPVTIIEYASMTCSHCGDFHTMTLPDVKRELIETGKVKFIYRDLPLDKFALKAAMMARCVSKENYFNIVEVIFNNQTRWVSSEDPLKALAQLGTLAGLSQEQFDACVTNTELEEALMAEMDSAAKKYNLKATPSFIFNDGAEVMTGYKPLQEFEAVIERLK